MNKRFDPELYKKNDSLAKKHLQKILEGQNYIATESPKKTDVDFSVSCGGTTFCNLEVEVKIVWSGDKFPYETLQIPQRKQKYAKLALPTVFLVFNKDCTHYATVLGPDLLDSKIAKVYNRYVQNGEEEFYQINLELVEFDSLVKVLNKLKRS